MRGQSKRVVIGAVLVGVFLSSVSPAESVAQEKVIVDTDPGTDDAMALLLALNSAELDVRGVTVVAGNVPLRQGYENARKIVSLGDRCEIPVAAGAERPLAQALTTAEVWHGANGLGGAELPPSDCPREERFASDLIVDLVHRHPGEITLVPVGPLTNIALAVLRDPSIVPLVKRVVLMGGSISGGNVTPAAEFNIYNDPEAAQVVFSAGWPVTMVGLDVTERTLFTREHLEELRRTRGPQNDFAVRVLTHLVALSEEHGFAGTSMHDPLAVGTVIDPTLVQIESMRIDVETRGELTRGETVANRHLFVEKRERRGDHYVVTAIEKIEPNAEVCVEVDAERFIRLFLGRVRGK